MSIQDNLQHKKKKKEKCTKSKLEHNTIKVR